MSAGEDQPSGARATLLVLAPPVEEHLPSELLELVAARGGISLYEARLRMVLPGIPRPVAVVPDPAVAQKDAERLTGLGLSCQAIDRDELQAHRDSVKEARAILGLDGEVVRLAGADGKPHELRVGAVISVLTFRQRVTTERAQVASLRVRHALSVGPLITELGNEAREHFDDEELVWVEPREGPPVLFRASTLTYSGDPAAKTLSQNLNFRCSVAPVLAMMEPSRVDDQLLHQRIVPGLELLGGDLLAAVALVALARRKGMDPAPPRVEAMLARPRLPTEPRSRLSAKVTCSNCLAEASGDVYYLVDQRPFCAGCGEAHLRRARRLGWRLVRWSREILVCGLAGILTYLTFVRPNLLLLTGLAVSITWLVTRPFHRGAGVDVIEVRREPSPHLPAPAPEGRHSGSS